MIKRFDKNKKAQIKLSFGMIFSIIIIIFILTFAFWGIKKVMGIQQSALISKFESDFQDDITTMWSGPQGQQTVSYTLPNKIEGVCITESNYEDMYFLPISSRVASVNLLHVNFEKTVENNNGQDLCFKNVEGKVEITLKKEFGETLVTIVKI